ncbi:MAG: hypothetical protein LBN11_07865 [Tannerella sp.]|jgi:predicted esterase|nr:hypothetical protein [Tannerella sp.]
MLRKHLIFLIVGVTLFSSVELGAIERPGKKLKFGRNIFEYDLYEPLKEKPVNLHYYIPQVDNVKELPILIAFHGNGRNAVSYMNVWARLAEANNIIVVIPEFTPEIFPGSDYNTGGILMRNVVQPEEKWAFSIIEPIFDFVRSDIGSVQTTYDIFGHSAGAQFAHRFLMFKRDTRVNRATIANAGWYTVPDEKIGFPYGIKASPVKQRDLKNFFGKEVYLLLGTEDTDPNHKDLKKDRYTNKQGPHRYARGYYFMEQLKRISAAEGFELNWKIVDVEGAGHSNTQMAPAAVEVLYKQK